MVEHLPSKGEVVNLNPSTTKNYRKRKTELTQMEELVNHGPLSQWAKIQLCLCNETPIWTGLEARLNQ
jgi:hypothetical protein